MCCHIIGAVISDWAALLLNRNIAAQFVFAATSELGKTYGYSTHRVVFYGNT